ncbi:archaea-specific SMC-related protein [Haloarchaeobius litoreus]|uniref:Archaea-specific SMC-related protein n=1 Tax=Haloarchaeobius litoreus TaxID=755306 RepID=A0ABD6DNE1_9EURY|nr:archaea-specific SMC-related protein [Haloarchaeobius litoreus]
MTWTLDIENIAGILDGKTTVEPGLNAVRAENWRGKSSLIRAVETAMGTRSPLTEGAAEGRVTLRTEDDEYEVRLSRQGRTVARNGTPYLEDEYDRACASLYAFLTEDNPIRAAVQNGENLESYLTRPLELENINEQIADLQAERSQVESELNRARSASEKLVSKQTQIASLEEELAELETRREEIEEPPENAGSRDDLSSARAEQERIEGQIERLEKSIERIEENLAEHEAELADLEVPDHSAIEADLERLEERVTEHESDIELLKSVYSANRRVVEEGRTELVSDVERGLVEDSMSCWVCGAETDRGALEDRLEALQGKITELEQDANAYRTEKRELQAKKDEQRQKERRERELEREIGNLESQLEERRESLVRKRDSVEAVTERVAELEETVSDQENELTAVESDIKYTQEKLSDLRSEVETLEERAAQQSTLEDERRSLSDEIEALRTRRERMKTETREAFSEAITEIIETFETSYESARLTSNFDLVVARDGREASLDALSEGEVVLLGLVAALAGYEAYDVADRVPVILVDSLGGLTDRNLHLLVDYLSERSERVVCTAYPEQSSFEGHDIDPAEWDVVSDQVDATA